MNKKRAVFLFGAGATMSWGSPSTWELTNSIREAGFKTNDNTTTITEYLYQNLLRNGFKEKEVNFETIINVIEELIVYYSFFDGQNKIPSLSSTVFNCKVDEDIFNFSIKGGEQKHGYQLDIPKGVPYDFTKISYHNETPKQFFLYHLLSGLLTTICSRISKFAYHTAGNSVLNTDSGISKAFVKWMTKLSAKHALRLYTLNYERIFKVLLAQNGIALFEGFEVGEYIPYSTDLRADIPKILNDFDCNVFYNLHGSAYWKVIDEDRHGLPNSEIALTAAPNFAMNDTPASFQAEKGKPILVTNIITGYQKVQKSNLPPFRQMQSAFDKDCCDADSIYVVGYSFGDEHINLSIRTAIRYNEKVKIIIIDPSFIRNDMDYQFALRFFPFKLTGNMHPLKSGEQQYSYFDGQFIVHTQTFEEFLNNQL